MKRIFKLLSDIWNDNVWGTVISTGILAGIVWLFKTISSKVLELMDFFKIDIPLYVCLIELALFLSVIIRLIVFLKKQKKVIWGKNNEIKNQNDLIQNLQEEINELKKEPDDPRMGEFKEGDVVIRKNSNPLSAEEYVIGGKKGNKIIVIDGNGNENAFPSHALLTVDEYEKAVQEAQDEIHKHFNNKTMNQMRLW